VPRPFGGGVSEQLVQVDIHPRTFLPEVHTHKGADSWGWSSMAAA
jgi:hypothetical protein